MASRSCCHLYPEALAMDEKQIRNLVEAGMLRKVAIVANGGSFHVTVSYGSKQEAAQTQRGKVRTWTSLDAAARWVRKLGIGHAEVELTHWAPGQQVMKLS